jgi:hypothetical protein
MTKNYNLPSKSGFYDDEHPIILESYDEAYKLGYQAAKEGKDEEKDNPHELSGHERDTTYSDELHHQWYCGFNDYLSEE